ncbi:unnamed protein product [Mytilus coruscus]|uniref:Uncharacterized protein n=1 Tax=Mytilus coruscus TaxID=42192 RepID=A0A6J8EAB9_MYTCO|nr:unnamed protein product [Mytilus coruscus]
MISSKRKLTSRKVKDPKLDTLNHRVKLLTRHKLTTKNVISVVTDMKRKKEKCPAWGKHAMLAKISLDSAADVNTICKRYIRKEQVKPSTITLRMWNKTPMKLIGEVHLNLINPKNGDETMATLVVVPNGHMNLLGLDTIRRMGLITVNDDRFIAKVETQKIGDLGEITLKVDENVPAKTLPSRKLPLSLQDDVKKEIDKLVERQVLITVTEPSKWVSQMAVVRKPNGKLRICIDPQPLNTALMREHYKVPTLDDVLPKLANAKIFSLLDVQEAYWHVKLDKGSSNLTTMITPFGRYRWARLPFGLKEKKEVGLTEITCHGHRITREGVKVDNAKVKAIQEMPCPTDVTGVKRLCGMVQCMAKFLPDLSNDLAPIRELTRKEAPWKWSDECEAAFQTVKKRLTEAPILSYFDVNKEVVLQVDSSKSGLGAVLMQEGKPVEFASRALKPSECNWAQIEKEALSMLYGLAF